MFMEQDENKNEEETLVAIGSIHPTLETNFDDDTTSVIGMEGGSKYDADFDGDTMKLPGPWIDRELSWLEFNNRVLNLAKNKEIPLLERVKFLSITNSNLDEFFAIRLASRFKGIEDDIDNIQEDRTVKKILRSVRTMRQEIDHVYNVLSSELDAVNINITKEFNTNKIRKFFKYEVKPSLAPLTIDSTRPFPHLKPFSIYIGLVVVDQETNTERMGIVEIPPHLDRLNKIGKNRGWFFIEDLIIENINELYPGTICSDIFAFRVIRDGDTITPTDDDKGYVESMVINARSRILYNDPVRLDIWGQPKKKIINTLQSELDINHRYTYNIDSRLKLSDIIQLYKASDDPSFKYGPFKPIKRFGSDTSILKAISRNDVIVHHPYESFNDTVLRFIREACEDPHVISIKQTLYRSGEDSKIVKYLIRAAESGKNVTVVMELKARFDEETNIEWAYKLQRAGATVVYGWEHIKTHAKLLQVFRKKGKAVEQFCHIGTGNYSEKNSKVYTDFSYFTSDKKICSDINNIFNMLTGGIISDKVKFNNIHIAPLKIRQTLYNLIDEQTSLGESGYICIKVNNLSDIGIVEKLYQASMSGVTIDIICRGACSLWAQHPIFSSNIRVKSIVGRFLEHSRVLMFGKPKYTNVTETDTILDVSGCRMFITSADLMTRNLDRRLEILFELEPTDMKQYISSYLETMMADEFNSYQMVNGEYVKEPCGVDGFDSQGHLMISHSKRDSLI